MKTRKTNPKRQLTSPLTEAQIAQILADEQTAQQELVAAQEKFQRESFDRRVILGHELYRRRRSAKESVNSLCAVLRMNRGVCSTAEFPSHLRAFSVEHLVELLDSYQKGLDHLAAAENIRVKPSRTGRPSKKGVETLNALIEHPTS